MRYLDGNWWIWEPRMTKQELIEQYKKTIENNKPYTEWDISDNLNKAFNFKTKVTAETINRVLNDVIKDLEHLD